jgi:hypothetical protein
MTIECLKYTSVNKGSLLGYADFYVPKTGQEIYGCQLHQKEGRRWINLPSKEYTNDLGEKKFAPCVRFRERSHMDAFSEACKKAIEKKCAEAPAYSAPAQEEELPF